MVGDSEDSIAYHLEPPGQLSRSEFSVAKQRMGMKIYHRSHPRGAHKNIYLILPYTTLYYPMWDDYKDKKHLFIRYSRKGGGLNSLWRVGHDDEKGEKRLATYRSPDFVSCVFSLLGGESL